MTLDVSLKRGGLLRGPAAAFFLIAAALKFATLRFEVEAFTEHFGFPLWVMYAVATAETVGALLLFTRGLAAHGALLLTVLMIGALATHLRVGDPVSKMIPAALLLVLMAGLAYARRAEFFGSLPRRARPQT